jgi:hypothetical protein
VAAGVGLTLLAAVGEQGAVVYSNERR